MENCPALLGQNLISTCNRRVKPVPDGRVWKTVCVNNVCSDFKDIISGVSQGSIVGPMLFNAFLNDFFFCIQKASVYNFADDNILSSFAKSVTLLLETLMAESNAIKWFSENKMIVNPDKFKSIVIHKKRQTSKPKQFLIGNDVVEVASSVKLLGNT